MGEDTVIIACDTLEDELKGLLAELGRPYPVTWLEAGLHNRPEKLRAQVNEALAGLDCRRVIMALGHCGGACAGLKAGPAEVVLPRTDDCLSLLMGSMERRHACAATYFLTAGWLRSPECLPLAFARDSAKFGPARALRLYKAMLKNYKKLGFVETGAYDVAAEEAKMAPLANQLGLPMGRLAGDGAWLRRLITGPWDGPGFLVVKPHGELTEAQWAWLGNAPLAQ